MKLYHIHKPNKYDELFVEGNSFEVGKKGNSLYSEFLNRSSSYLHHTEEIEGQIYNHRNNINELLEIDEINKMTSKQKRDLFYLIKGYVIDSQIDIRELILEEVRYKHFNNLPSRRSCMWLTDEESLDRWYKLLNYKDGYSLYEVDVDGNIFVSTNTLLPKSHCSRDLMYRASFDYWNPKEENLKDAKDKEYLFEGEVKVLRRVK